MCGISACITTNGPDSNWHAAMDRSLEHLLKRGPDFQDKLAVSNILFGHTRLSIIDTSAAGNQPMQIMDGRYTIVFNGEIYNYRSLKKDLESRGHAFRSSSDTEVLLHLYAEFGTDCIEKLDGFFAFALYDKTKDELLVARDRMGIKPLVYSWNEGNFCLASNVRALQPFLKNQTLSYPSLFAYLQLNYIPAPHTILEGVHKLEAGHYLLLTNASKNVEQAMPVKYFDLESNVAGFKPVSSKDYIASKQEVRRLLDESVQRRLVSDVPLGTFLSGGVDSSVITYLASVHKPDIMSFSIGFEDKFFDETEFALEASKAFGTQHHVFRVGEEEMKAELDSILDYQDEPFGDSSAIPVYVLSKKTREHVTVALSGDGADELFSGYNKHAAEFRVQFPGPYDFLLPLANSIGGLLPRSRNSWLSNKVRQLDRYVEGRKLSKRDRYWRWAAYLEEEEANYYIREMKLPRVHRLSDDAYSYKKLKEEYLRYLSRDKGLNDVLLTDLKLVLQNDMLKKVDSMSMANSLEVRTPFLNHELVKFVSQLPQQYKINSGMRKRILQDTFKKELPESIYNRRKQGFEIPLLNWFSTSLKPRIEDDLLSRSFVEEQGIFNPEAIESLKRRLFSKSPGESVATTWALISFQAWWKRNMANA